LGARAVWHAGAAKCSVHAALQHAHGVLGFLKIAKILSILALFRSIHGNMRFRSAAHRDAGVAVPHISMHFMGGIGNLKMCCFYAYRPCGNVDMIHCDMVLCVT
jgi:hypothetical protein